MRKVFPISVWVIFPVTVIFVMLLDFVFISDTLEIAKADFLGFLLLFFGIVVLNAVLLAFLILVIRFLYDAQRVSS